MQGGHNDAVGFIATHKRTPNLDEYRSSGMESFFLNIRSSADTVMDGEERLLGKPGIVSTVQESLPVLSQALVTNLSVIN